MEALHVKVIEVLAEPRVLEERVDLALPPLKLLAAPALGGGGGAWEQVETARARLLP